MKKITQEQAKELEEIYALEVYNGFPNDEDGGTHKAKRCAKICIDFAIQENKEKDKEIEQLENLLKTSKPLTSAIELSKSEAKIKELQQEVERLKESKSESQIIVESLAHERHSEELKAELQASEQEVERLKNLQIKKFSKNYVQLNEQLQASQEREKAYKEGVENLLRTIGAKSADNQVIIKNPASFINFWKEQLLKETE